jgi:hypothetical protein
VPEHTLTNFAAKHSTCGLYFSQMRFENSSKSVVPLVTPRHRLKAGAGGSKASHHYPSMSRTVGTQVNADPRKYKRRSLKLKRIRGVKRDLSDLQRVFVFEQEANGDRMRPRTPGQTPGTEAAKSRQTSQNDRVLEVSGEHDGAMTLAEDVMLNADKSTPGALNSRKQDRLRTFNEATPLIEADERWDVHSMTSCFTSASLLESVYENGRRYHGFCAGLYL